MLSLPKPRLRNLKRPTAWLSAAALAVAGMTAVTTTSAHAVVPDATLVVVDTLATSTNLSAVALKTFSASDGSSLRSDVNLPTSASGSNNPFTLSGSTNANGALSLTADGNYLTVAGYAGVPDNSATTTAPSPKGTAASALHRVVARIDQNGVADTSTDLGASAFSLAHPRAVTSANGSTFYVAGDDALGTADHSGILKYTLGSSSPTPITNGTPAPTAPAVAAPNIRLALIAGGDLYATSSATPKGFLKIGTGLPTSVVGANVLTSTGGTPTGMALLDTNAGVAGIDTAYIVTDTTAILKYTYNGTAWALAGTLTSKTGTYSTLTAKVDGGQVDLYATVGGSSSGAIGAGNSLVAFQDTNPSGAPSYTADATIATASATHAFRGVAFAPTAWKTAPKPTNVTATAGQAQATINWNAVPGADSYSVYLKDGGTNVSGSPKSVTAPTTTAVFKNLDPTKSYTATVIAHNGPVDSVESDSASVTPDAITTLDKPTGVAASHEVQSTTITWDPVDNATAYNVSLKDGTTDVTGSPATVSSSGALSKTFTGLDEHVTYTATVVATNGSIVSPESDGVNIQPDAPALDKPTGVTATAGVLKITVVWDAVTGADSYRVHLKTGGVDIADSPHTVLPSDPAGLTTEFTGLDPSKSYTATVNAVNLAGSSPESDGSTVTPLDVPSTVTAVAAPRNTTYGEPMTVTVTVTSADTTDVPTGGVTVKIGSHSYPGTLNGSGVADISVPGGDVVPGTFTIKTTYAGVPGTFKASSKDKTLNVARASTVIPTPVFTPATLKYTLTSTVKINVNLASTTANPSIHPTGTVEFYDGTKLVTSKAMASSDLGTVTLNLPKFTKATHSFTVKFIGTKSLFNSKSLTFTKQVT